MKLILVWLPFLLGIQGSIIHSDESPVESFVAQTGRPLRDYNGKIPVSNQLKTAIEKVSKIGQPLQMKCESNEKKVQKCIWTDPKGVEFDVNQPPEGVTVVINDEKTCQIQIDSLTKSQLGKWSCKITLENEAQYQKAYLTATETVPVTDVRLPLHAIPQLYTIHLTPFIILGNFTIEGHVSIEIDILEPANNITLHIKDIQIYENMVTLTKIQDGSQIPIEGHGYDAVREFYIVNMALVEAGKYQLDIGYLAELNDKLAGFYRSSYKVGNQTKYLATSQMEATDARRAVPCFDEPALKAKFQTNIGRTQEFSSISNMPISQKGVPMADNSQYVWDIYQTSVKMSTYLLAFVVSDFEFRQGTNTNNGVDFRIWSRQEAVESTEYAGQIGPKVLQFYEGYFKIPFPLPKQDMIAIPDFSAGAMENWGLITYREVALLHDPQADSKSRRIYVATVVAHELAHQWFGDLVTMKWWDDLWLNEGFASYVETIGADHVEPEASILDRFCIDNTYDTMEIDSLKTSHPISAKVKHPDQINEIFDRISYGKGASIIRMMYHFLGENTFVEGLTQYLNKYSYSNAEQDDLWQVLTTVAHQKGSLKPDLSVKTIMDTWTLQMGYPVLNVKRNDNKLIISQQRFLTGNNSSEDYKWWVPITFDHENGYFNQTLNSVWLSPTDQEITVNLPNDFTDKAVIINVQQTGYFRVNYDVDNWKMIIEALERNPDSIHRVNRGQIFNDLFNLAKEGQVSYVQAMDATKSLFQESDLIPWRSGLFSLKYIRLMLRRSPSYGLFRKYMKQEMLKPYRKLGFFTKITDSIDDTDLRTDIVGWMCLLGYDDCKKQSDLLFKAYMDNSKMNPIDPGLRGTVYCQAIADGDEKEWNFLWNKLRVTSNANERNNILKGLACTNEVWILQRYLEMTIDPNSMIRRQDGSSVIANIAMNPVGRYMTWNWLRNDWDKISDYFDTAISSAIGRIVSYTTRDFNTPFELKELQDFYEEHKNELGTARSATLNSIENVKANVKWMENYYGVIKNWLVENVGSNFSPKRTMK